MADTFLEAHRIAAGVFSISGRLHPISIRDQMLRSHEFVRRALDAELIEPGSPDDPQARKFLVVGAGVAGVTAAIQAAEAGVPTTLIEKADVPFATFAKCDTRVVDPTQYDWPLGHWRVGKFCWHAGLVDSVLPWNRGDYAHVLANVWRAKFNELRSDTFGELLQFRRSRQLNKVSVLTPVAGGRPGVVAEIKDCRSGEVRDFKAGIILIATGFGYEDCHLGSFDGTPFWSTDSLSKPKFGIGKTQPRVLISGGGDGALQDFLRVLVRPVFKSARRILRWLPPQPELFKRFQDSYECAERKHQWDGGRQFDHHVLTFLQQRFDEVVDEYRDACGSQLDRAMTLLLRDPLPEVTLVYPCDHFGRSYPLNRFLATLFARYLQDRPRKHDALPLLNPKRVVVDLGPQSVPGSHFPIYPYTIENSSGCWDRTGSGSAQSSIADIVLVRHGPKFDKVSDDLKPLLFPPRAQQLMPFGFVKW